MRGAPFRPATEAKAASTLLRQIRREPAFTLFPIVIMSPIASVQAFSSSNTEPVVFCICWIPRRLHTISLSNKDLKLPSSATVALSGCLISQVSKAVPRLDISDTSSLRDGLRAVLTDEMEDRREVQEAI